MVPAMGADGKGPDSRCRAGGVPIPPELESTDTPGAEDCLHRFRGDLPPAAVSSIQTVRMADLAPTATPLPGP